MPTANQPTSMTTGTSSAASQPAGIRLLSASGSSRIHINPATINAKGMRNSIENTAGRWLSTNGANQSPAKKPRITVGTASMISMDGLTTCRNRGDIKYALYTAPKIASGGAENIA